MLYLIILVIIIISYIEGLPFIKNKQWKELTVLETMLGISLLLVIGKKLGITTPIAYLDNVLSPIGKAILGKH